MGRARRITRTHCLDCGCKLTDENRYASVRSRCKLCHIAKVKGLDQTKPPKATTKAAPRTFHEPDRSRAPYDDMPDSRQLLITNYKKLGLEEYLPAALAEIDEERRNL